MIVVPVDKAVIARRKVSLFILLAMLIGCKAFTSKDDSKTNELRRHLDYPIYSARFKADGELSEVAFTNLQVVPEIRSNKWVAFSSGSSGHEVYAISDQTLAKLNQNGQLCSLSMVGVQLVSKTGWSRFHLGGIQHLDLAATNVSDGTTGFLRSGEELRFLDLTGTSIGDATLDHLMSHQKLLYLRLNGTEVSDNGVALLTAIPSLIRIEVRDTLVTEAGRTSYRTAGGKAEIVLDTVAGGVL